MITCSHSYVCVFTQIVQTDKALSKVGEAININRIVFMGDHKSFNVFRCYTFLSTVYEIPRYMLTRDKSINMILSAL